jgi:hypothetical protein
MRVDSNGAIDIAFIKLDGTGISLTRSLDGGATFSAPTLALPTPVYPDEMQMELDASNDIVILVVYAPFEANGNPLPDTSAVSRSTDGQTFTTTPVATHGFFPQLAVEPAGGINVAWLDSSDSSLHEVRSADGGATFSPDQTIWTTTLDAIDVAAIAGPQGQLYLIWGQEADLTCDILFTASLDGAKTFSTPAQLSASDGGCNVNPVPVIDAAGNLDIAWEADGNSVFFTRSTDQGQTFSTPTQPAQNMIEVSSQQFAVGPNGEIDMVFDAAIVDFSVFFTRSTDNGATFSTPTRLSLPAVANFTGGGDPFVAVDSTGKISVAWEDDSNGSYSGDFDIYMATSTDGVTFSTPVDLSNTTDQTEVFPQIVTNSAGVRYLVWYDTEDTQAANQTLSVFFDSTER